MFSSPDWISRLESRLQQSLPGLAAQMQMAPGTRQAMLKAQNFIVPSDAKQSAVLLVLYPGAEGISFPLIERSAYEGVHSRQISLPGGQTDPGDASHVHTALREAEEEIGLSKNEVRVIGQLSELYIPPSNFIVQPVIAVSEVRPRFVLDPVEVASLIETPVLPLLDGHFSGTSMVKARGMEYEVPSFTIQGHVVWGATAMMLSELVVVMNGLREG